MGDTHQCLGYNAITVILFTVTHSSETYIQTVKHEFILFLSEKSYRVFHYFLSNVLCI